MLGIYILIGIIGVIAAGFLAYLTWRFFNRHANRRGADVEERPAGSFHQLGSQSQGLQYHSEHQLRSGSENNQPSLEAQYQRVRPHPLSVRPSPLPNPQSLSGPENYKQLAKPPPCRLTFGSENQSSLSAQPQQPAALEHPSQPKPKCRLAMRVFNEESYRRVRNLPTTGVVYDDETDIAFELYFNSEPINGIKIDGVLAQPEWQATEWGGDPLEKSGLQPLALCSSSKAEWRKFPFKRRTREGPRQQHME